MGPSLLAMGSLPYHEIPAMREQIIFGECAASLISKSVFMEGRSLFGPPVFVTSLLPPALPMPRLQDIQDGATKKLPQKGMSVGLASPGLLSIKPCQSNKV